MTPWAGMLRTAVSMGLAPEAFWRLSLREWRWLTADGAPGLSAAGLAALMARYPDEGD